MDKNLANLRNIAKMNLNSLTQKAIRALDEAFDEGSIKDKLTAARLVLESTGLAVPVDEKQSQDIRIVLPINIKADTKDQVIEVEANDE